jgi:hypothetical protein
LKKSNDLNYLLYTIDTEVGDHICDIAGALIFQDDPSKALKEAYPSADVLD